MTMKRIHPVLENVLAKYDRLIDLKARVQKLEGKAEKAPSGLGFLTLVASDAATGKILQVEHGQNIVVNTGRSGLAHLLCGDATANHIVTTMRFGDGAGTPAVTDTGLFGVQIIDKATAYAFPDGPTGLKVSFTAVVGALEGNGGGTQVYQEVALLKGNGDLFSHKVSGSISKDNSIVLTAVYTFIF